MIRAIVLGGVCATAFCAYATAGQAAVTFTSAQVNSNALASAMSGSKTANGSGSDADAVSAFTPTLDASSYADAATVVKAVSTAQAQALEDASATFTSPSAGTITLSGMTTETVSSPSAEAQAQDDGQYYTYDFTVTTPSTFDLTYNYTETYSGVENSFILLDESNFTTIGQLQGGPNTSGLESYSLAAGNYSFGASTAVGDFSFESGAGAASGSHDESYAFNITSAAPEPSTWALMMTGVGILGFALRRDRFRSAESMAAVAAG